MNASTASRVTIETLGAFGIRRDGVLVDPSDWQSRKARTALKILVAKRGQPVTRDALMESLWPDESPDVLSNRLSVALAVIRSVFDPEHRFEPDRFVQADASAVSLRIEHLSVDVERFMASSELGLRLWRAGDVDEAVEHLDEADRLYAGDFLGEDLYEDWSFSLRERARSRAIAVTRALATFGAASGDVDGAVDRWLQVLSLDEFDEEAHVGLVRVLDRAGRHGEAWRAYGTYVQRMVELDVAPADFPVDRVRIGARHAGSSSRSNPRAEDARVALRTA